MIRRQALSLSTRLRRRGVSFRRSSSQFNIRPWRFLAGQSVATAGAVDPGSLFTRVAPAASQKRDWGSLTASDATGAGDRFVCQRAFPLRLLGHAAHDPTPARRYSRAVATLALFFWTPRSSIAARLSASLLTPFTCGVAPRNRVRRLASWRPGSFECGQAAVVHRLGEDPSQVLLPAFVMPPRTTLSRRWSAPTASARSRGERPGVLNLEKSPASKTTSAASPRRRPSGTRRSPSLPPGPDASASTSFSGGEALSSVACLVAST